MWFRLLFLLFALTISSNGQAKNPSEIATQILAPLLDPVKVATLKGDRPANARLYRVMYWLETARMAGGDVSEILVAAQTTAGYANTPMAAADQRAIEWSRRKLQDYGCFTPPGMEKLRKGGSPVITLGPYAGTAIALDHVLPRAVVPELAAKFYNLEAIPASVNRSKSAKVGSRELAVALRWKQEGLLSAEGLAAIILTAL